MTEQTEQLLEFFEELPIGPTAIIWGPLLACALLIWRWSAFLDRVESEAASSIERAGVVDETWRNWKRPYWVRTVSNGTFYFGCNNCVVSSNYFESGDVVYPTITREPRE